MTAGGRPKGPLRKYTIECMWPSNLGSWRTTVAEVDEKTARRSAAALKRMRHPFRVKLTLISPNKKRTPLGSHLISRWNRQGEIVEIHEGGMRFYMPSWALGEEPLEKEKTDDRVAHPA